MISVALCTYNGERYIKEQLESILKQTITPDEIIMVDDISLDNTVEIAESVLRDSGVYHEIVINSTRLGVSKNFEKAIRFCKGDFIFTADQDDVWKDNKIERILSCFDEDVSLVFTNAELVDANLNPQGTDLWKAYCLDIEGFNENYQNSLLKKDYITGATMAFRTFDFDKVFPVPESLYHDQWIGLNALRFGKVQCINDKLILYRQHSNNVIGAKKPVFLKRSQIFISNIPHSQELKQNRRYIYSCLYDKCKNDSSCFPQKLRLYLDFYRDALTYCTLSKVEGLKWVLNHRKEYSEYYIGDIGVIRDVIYILSNSKPTIPR